MGADPLTTASHVSGDLETALLSEDARADDIPSLDEFPPASLVNRRYRVEYLIGSGGMGSVYSVTDEWHGGRPLALKTVRRDVIKPDHIDLFKAEFRTLTGFHHPNVASVYDFEPLHGTQGYLFTMERVDGANVFVDTDNADLETVLDLFVQICRALSYVHSRGIIHFDLKPSNLLVSRERRVKVLDFGIAGTVRQAHSRLIGTPAYMAPELLDAARADHRADLYSLGIILYQLINRRHPFAAQTVNELIRMHARDTIGFDDAIGRVPDWLRDLIVRLCAKQPADRFRSANAVIEAINQAAGYSYELETRETRESYILSSRFIGRKREFDRVAALITQRITAFDRAAPMLFVSGSSGVGKSRLMREVRHHAQLSGFTFVEANCYEGSFSEYRPVADAVSYLIELCRASGASTPAVQVPVEFLPAESRLQPTTAPDWVEGNPIREQLRLREQTAEFLIEAAGVAPYVLYFNDLHWAQPGTIAILTHLARRLATAEVTGQRIRLAVLGTFRDEEMSGQPFEALLRELEERHVAEIVPLAPLTVEDVDGLVGSMLGADAPEAFVQRLAHETAGIPFFVEEMMRTLIENGSVYLERGVWAAGLDASELAIPTSVAKVLRRRAALLDPAAQSVLIAAAAHGRPAQARMLAAATSLAAADFGSALRRLLQQRMILTVPGESVSYAVAHDRMREVVYGDLSHVDRRRTHASLAEAIESTTGDQLDDSVYELARHYWLAGNQPKAFSYSLRGARRARATYANDVAVELFQRAVDLSDQQATELRRELQENLGDVHALTGRFGEALTLYRKVMTAVEGESHRARLFRKIANVHWQKGELDASVGWLWRAAEALGDARPISAFARAAGVAAAVGRHLRNRLRPPRSSDDPAERERLLELSVTYFHLGEAYFFHDSSQMLLPILRASNAGERAGQDSTELCRAYHAVVVLYGTLTLWRSAVTYAQRVTAMAERLDSQWDIGAAHTYWLILHYYRGESQQGIERGRAGKQILARCGDVMELSFAYWVTALCHYYRGELHRAAEWLDEGLATMRRTDSEQPSKGLLAVSARVNARLGRAKEARQQIERSIALATQAQDLFLQTWALMLKGDCLLVEGDVDEAVNCLESAKRQREIHGLLPEYLMETYSLLALARLEQLERQKMLTPSGRQRQLAEIDALARKALRLARRRPHFRSPALRVAALCGWRRGRHKHAEKLFMQSAAAADALGAPLQLGEVHDAWGRCLLEAGRAEEGTRHMAQACELFERTGAVPFVDRVNRILGHVKRVGES